MLRRRIYNQWGCALQKKAQHAIAVSSAFTISYSFFTLEYPILLQY
jgi:hypothetical protein